MSGYPDEIFTDQGPHLHGVADDVYSPELKELAQRCVKLWSEERVGLAELQKEIESAIENREDFVKYDMSGSELLHRDVDKYALGLALSRLPAAN